MTYSNFQTSNQLGLPLSQPSKQTILPVVCGGNGNLQGFFAINATTFTGTETSFALLEGSVAITSVTLPQKVDNGSGFGVGQYMAVVYPDDEVRERPWLGYSAFVATDDVGYLGAHHQLPTQGWGTRYYLGTLVTNLEVNMAADVSSPPTTAPPVVTSGTLRWAASVKVADLEAQCPFIDFNWVDLFKAGTTNVDPLRIDVVSNPPGGFFKSTLVPYTSVAPLGGVQFNTIRIIRLGAPPPADYTFNYVVTDSLNQTTNVALTLTVV
jgi:hypothetical protein